MRVIVSSKRHSAAGFTLLEVLLALAILAIAGTSLLGLVNRSLALHDRLRQTTRATLLAQSQLALLSGSNAPLVENGRFAAPDERFHWRLQRSATPLGEVERRDLTVSWGDETRHEAVTLTAFARSGATP